MLIPEIISPNVKVVLPSAWRSIDPLVTRIHRNGVIEIDARYRKGEGSTLSRKAEVMFSDYQQAGAVYPVNTTGLPGNDSIGSERFCTWDPGLAEKLTAAINQTGVLEILKSGSKFVNVSKYFRFMRYLKGGEHFPHYDTDFEGPNYVTKYSLVMYFTDCESGEIAFIQDRLNEREPERRHDWSRQAENTEIELMIKPKEGRIVLFPHHLCHTVLPYTDKEGSRIVARGDLIFTP